MPPRALRFPQQLSKTQVSADRKLAELGGPHGVVTTAECRAAGLSQRQVDHRIAIGRLYRWHKGVYSVGRPWLDREGRYLAAVKAVGEGAALSHRAAGVLWGLLPGHRWGDGPIDVTAPPGPRPRPGIRLHAATRRDIEGTLREGIPVTSPLRTLQDLAATIAQQPLRRAVNEALVQKLVTERELAGAVESRARGTARLRDLLATAAPTRSELEDRFLALLDAHGLPRPRTNVVVAGLEVDAYFEEAGLVVELDGRAYHGSSLARRRDRERDRRLGEAGVTVLRLGWGDVVHDGAATAARLRSALPR